MAHVPICVSEILNFFPEQENGIYLDVTGGGGGHSEAILKLKKKWKAEIWDTDPEAVERLKKKFSDFIKEGQVKVEHQNFKLPPNQKGQQFSFILADLGVSSFQLDDKTRGLSLFSESAPDFRLNKNEGPGFQEWLNSKSEKDLADIFEKYGDEPKSKVAAKFFKETSRDQFTSAKKLAQGLADFLKYPSPSRIHPATRIFQALRIAINDEWGALDSFLDWAPKFLAPKGVLALLTFHSLEDGRVKNVFRDLASGGGFDILTKKPLGPSEQEIMENPRSRSAKLRALRRK